jgi:hypothetical protein
MYPKPSPALYMHIFQQAKFMNVNCDKGRARQRPADHNKRKAPSGYWNSNAAKILVVVTKMGRVGPTADHLGGVIWTAQQIVPVEMKNLHFAVGRQIVRKSCPQAEGAFKQCAACANDHSFRFLQKLGIKTALPLEYLGFLILVYICYYPSSGNNSHFCFVTFIEFGIHDQFREYKRKNNICSRLV